MRVHIDRDGRRHKCMHMRLHAYIYPKVTDTHVQVLNYIHAHIQTNTCNTHIVTYMHIHANTFKCTSVHMNT